MLESVELFFQRHQYTVTAIGAVGSISAVVVALVLAFASRRANQTHLKASASLSFIMHDSIPFEQRPFYLTINITNTGIMPLRIPLSFLHWKVPFKKGVWLVTAPYDYAKTDEWVPQKRYPAEIAPRSSETFFIQTMEMFHEMYEEAYSTANFLRRCQLRFFKPRVITDDGKVFNVRIDADFQAEIKKLRASIHPKQA